MWRFEGDLRRAQPQRRDVSGTHLAKIFLDITKRTKKKNIGGGGGGGAEERGTRRRRRQRRIREIV